jgi:Ca-activated chloride channel family protein
MIEAFTALAAAVGIDRFEQPLWLLLVVPATAAWIVAVKERPASLGWSAIAQIRSAGGRRLDLATRLSTLLRAACLLALLGVLAGPVGLHRLPPEPGYGLDVVLALDASGSMRALDAEQRGENRTRIALAREVVARFAEHRASAGDRVALVVFGESAFTQCPLTSDGRLLSDALDRVEAGVAGEATAIGDALALAVKRVLGASGMASDAMTTDLASASAGAPTERIAGRLVVLLTDGRNNAGALSVELATAVAASQGIRIHTVGIGSVGNEVAMASADGRSRGGTQFERVDVDTDALRSIARTTGGRFFAARTSKDLEAVYREIDALERIARPLPPRIHQSDRPEPLLALAGSFLIAEIATTRVFRRRIS